VLVLAAFGGYSAGAAWQDLKTGTEHFTKWRRIALVADVEWMIHLVHLFGWMTPGEVEHFPSPTARRPPPDRSRGVQSILTRTTFMDGL
jgi:hypothetical protein